MSKEIEVIRQAVESKRQEIDTMVRNKQLKEKNKEKAISNEIERRRQKILTRSIKNQKLFQDAGVISLLEEIKDSGLLRFYLSEKEMPESYFGKEPIYRIFFSGVSDEIIGYKKVKKHCETPHIVWGGLSLKHPLNEDLYLDTDLNDKSTLSLIFNTTKSFRGDADLTIYNEGKEDKLLFYIKNNEVYIDDKKTSEIPNLPQYLDGKITKTID